MENTLLKMDAAARLAVVNDVKKRQESSMNYYDPKRREWERQYKKYRAMQDTVAEEDEPDIKIAIAFGMVEDIVARIVDNVIGKLTVMVKPKRPDHSKKANKFFNACRSFFGSPDFRIDYINSTRERAITGSSWEFDEWVSNYSEGKRWKKSPTLQKIESAVPTLAKVINFVADKVVNTISEVKHMFPVKVGPNTRFPSVFRVHPTPGVKVDRDLPWVIEEVPFVSLDELRQAQYTDPTTKGKRPVYDLSAIDDMKKLSPDTVIKPTGETDGSYNAFEELYTGVSAAQGGLDYGVDGVYLQVMRTPREIITVANGVYLIQHITDPFQKPGIKCRLRVFTQDPQGLYGIGIIEPIFDLLDQIDDVHNLVMADWVRAVNDMLLYDEEAIPYPDDFEARAGGKIRVKSGTILPTAVMAVPHGPGRAGEMITMESNLKGLAERISSISDMSPGTMGTKPYHSTFGGLNEITTSLAKRFRINYVVDQAQTMRQMDTIYWFFDQFMFEPLPFTDYSKGEGTAVEYTRDDFDTDGLGFCFVATDDPSYGDAGVLRNQNMVLMDLFLRYEQTRRSLGADWKAAQPDEQLEVLIESFGKTDVSKFLKADNGVLSPDQEWSMMLQGLPVDPNPKENLSEHYVKHLWELRTAEQDPNIAPQFLVLAQDHIRKTQTLLAALLAHPEAFVEDEGRQKTLNGMAPGLPGGPQPSPLPSGGGVPPLGQSLPSNQGFPPANPRTPPMPGGNA